jgi:hypothetical protein
MQLEEVLALKAHELERLESGAGSIVRALPSLHFERARSGAPRVEVELPTLATLRRAKFRRHAVALGVALGVQEEDYRLAVRVQDLRVLESDLIDGIRRRAGGHVDIRYIGRAVPASLPDGDARTRRRPLAPGISVGAIDGRTTGTLGGFVRPHGGDRIGLFSNNHILANSNRAQIGSSILQPSWDDGGRDPGAIVGTLDRTVPLRLDGPNTVDCAIATLADGINWDPKICSAPLSGLRQPQLEESVAKLGRSTAYTAGTVAAIETGPVTFDYPIGPIVFDGLIEVHGEGPGRFADSGDSGSVVYSEHDRRAVGLIFGITRRGGRNGAGVTYTNPLPEVLEALRADLLLSSQ